jgi:hypothetical protein
MATILASLPFVPARWFDNSGNILSGGKLYFYAAGTTTPKDTYSNYLGTTPNANPVILDSSGHAVVFLGTGLYKVELRDANDVVFAPAIDGIGGTVGSGNALVVATYNDLRAIDNNIALSAVVLGRTVAGDGGAGLFAWDQDETAADDFGTILAPVTAPVSGRWSRVRGPDMDIRWWCAADGSTDDATTFGLAMSASAARKAPVIIEAVSVFTASNLTIPANAALKFAYGGKLTSSTALTLTTNSAGRFFGADKCLAGQMGLVPTGSSFPILDPDWFDRTTDFEKLSECQAHLSDDHPILIKRKLSLDTRYQQDPFAILYFIGEGQIFIESTVTGDTRIGRWEGNETSPLFVLDNKTPTATIALGYDSGRFLSPKVFGGNAYFARALQHGWVYLDDVYADDGAIVDFTDLDAVYLRGFQRKDNASTATTDWVFSGWVPLEDGPTAREYLFTNLSCEDLAIFNTSTDAGSAAKITVDNVFSAKNCALMSVDKTAPTFNEGILFTSTSGSISLYDCYSGNVAFNASTGVAEKLLSSATFYAYPTSATFQGTSWTFTDSLVGGVDDGVELVKCDNSTIGASGRLSLLSVVDSTLFADSYSTASNITLSNSNLGDGPIYITNPIASLTVNGSLFRWNGIGIACINNPIIYRFDSLSSLTNPNYLPCASLNGVYGPGSRYGYESLYDKYISTVSTAGWVCSPSNPTSTAGSVFYWDGSAGYVTARSLTRTIGTNAEKLIAAYGGTIAVKVTSGSTGVDTSVSSVRLIFGEHDQTVPGELHKDGDSWRWLFPIGPGADSTVTTYRVVINSGAALINEISVEITVSPVAPKTKEQWQTFWNWQDTIVAPISLTGSRCSVWRETLADNDRLNLWQNTSGNTLYIDAPDTLLLPSKHVGVQKINNALEYMIL